MKPHDALKIKRIILEVNEQLNKLEELFAEWENHRLLEFADTYLLRGKGSVFHDFYSGAEKIFQRIAVELNGGVPKGQEWHKIFLQNMMSELPGVRPPVIAAETGKLLKKFLEFRHMFRNVYGFDLEFEKLDDLDRLYPEAHKKFREDIQKFIAFLEQLVKKLETPP
jgi:hypothetical protein